MVSQLFSSLLPYFSSLSPWWIFYIYRGKEMRNVSLSFLYKFVKMPDNSDEIATPGNKMMIWQNIHDFIYNIVFYQRQHVPREAVICVRGWIFEPEVSLLIPTLVAVRPNSDIFEHGQKCKSSLFQGKSHHWRYLSLKNWLSILKSLYKKFNKNK